MKMQRKQWEYQQNTSGVTLHSDLKNAAVEGQCWCHVFPFLKLLYCLPWFMPKSFCVSILSLSLVLTTLHFEMSWCMEKHPIKAQDSHKLKMLLRWEAMYSLCWDSSLPINHSCWYTKAFAVKCLFITSKMPLTNETVSNSSHLKEKENVLLQYRNKNFRVQILLAQALFWEDGEGRCNATRDWGNNKWVNGFRECLKGIIKTRRVWYFRKGNTIDHRLFILDINWSVHKMGVGLVIKNELAWKASHEAPRTKVVLKFLF